MSIALYYSVDGRKYWKWVRLREEKMGITKKIWLGHLGYIDSFSLFYSRLLSHSQISLKDI